MTYRTFSPAPDPDGLCGPTCTRPVGPSSVWTSPFHDGVVSAAAPYTFVFVSFLLFLSTFYFFLVLMFVFDKLSLSFLLEILFTCGCCDM